MTEIEFSIISDEDDALELLSVLLQEFERRQRVKVKLTQMDWDSAWSTLLVNALHGKGPHVSHVGSTWGTTLGAMEALRPFSQKDLVQIGAPDAFMPLTWQSALRGGGQRVWAIPWTSYTYIICYRRDLIVEARLDETTAFATPQAMHASLARLRESGVKTPFAFPTTKNYLDLVHITASWIWGAEGGIVNEKGGRSQFALPEARQGLQAFFNLYQFIPTQIQGFDYDQCVELFSQGDAAVTIIGADDAIDLLKSEETDSQVRQNLGTANLPGIPWVGGDNLVIWKHTLGSSKCERAAIDLVAHLTASATQLQFAQLTNSLPVRHDALSKFLVDLEPLRETIQQTLNHGRSHAPVKVWSRIEHQFGMTLDQIAAQVLAEPQGDIDAILHQYLEPSAKRLDMILKR